MDRAKDMQIEENKVQNTKISLNRIKTVLVKRKFASLFIFLLMITVGALALKAYKPGQMPQTVKKTVIKQVLVKRSKDKGVIDRALTGKAVDVNTGRIVVAARVFSVDDKTVYLELDFVNAPKGTIIDYIRYKEGRYVDHGEVTIAKADTKNLLFNWTITKLFGVARDGKWKIATYTDGILAKRVAYEIRSNKVSYVFPGEVISPSDPDYKLNDVLRVESNSH